MRTRTRISKYDRKLIVSPKNACCPPSQCGGCPPKDRPPCTCGVPKLVPCVHCTCGVVEEVVEEEVVEEEKPRVLKRFFIYNKISTSGRWQREVMKKALASMADDGFPLAKLPDCYRLPHIKLWLQMRCRKFWTKEEKYKSILTSKVLWRHTNKCQRKVRVVHPDVTKEEALKLTWASAEKCKKLSDDAKDTYYRKLRQAYVNFGREFFPTTLSYEFPFRTFRNCYFAYTPAKEEDVLPRDVWAPYEHK